MKNIAIITFTILSISCKAQKIDNEFKWNLEKEKIQNENRNDSTKIDIRNWIVDTKNKIQITGKPFINGVFPVPKYDLSIDSFEGLGNSGDWKGFNLKNKKIIYHSLYVKKNKFNNDSIPFVSNKVYFSIIVLTDSIDLKNYSHTNVSISSRNHPHYIGQGFIRTKQNEVDFAAFITADDNSYAIVNMRLYDLRIGRIILIAPKKDGTLRSLQIDSAEMSSEEINNYIKDILTNNKKVIDFFTKPDNI